MRGRIMALIGVSFTVLTSASIFASGSAATQQKASASRAMDRASFSKAQTAAAATSQAIVVEEPYNLGKALYSGKYKFGHPKLTAANVAEKLQRLVALQGALPAPERQKVEPTELSKRLTNHEMNALEYYIEMRFGKSISKSPSWAKTEPPPKIASTK
jgi:hypothetical protein